MCVPTHYFTIKRFVPVLELQYALGDKLLKFQVVCPQNGTAVLKG